MERMITRRELIEIMILPLGEIRESHKQSIILTMLRKDEQEFLIYAQSVMPFKITPVIKNRYFLN